MTILGEKMLEVLRSVIPTVFVVGIVHLFSVRIPTDTFVAFLIGAVSIIIGLTIFLVGIDIALVPIGEHMGKGIAWSNKISVVVIAGFILGFFISVAEPSLTVLSNQIERVTSQALSSTLIISVVSIGIALMIIIGLLRIVYGFSIIGILTVVYGLILFLSFFTSNDFLALSFDASGATTGSITVPFLLALSTGISNLKKNRKESEGDSFGLVAIASSGAIISVMILNQIRPADELSGSLSLDQVTDGSVWGLYLNEASEQLLGVLMALLPIVVLFFMYQLFRLKLRKRRLQKIVMGLVYVCIGLILFLTGVNAGLMPVGSFIGYTLGSQGSYAQLSFIGFTLGMVSILAEPAVSVLTSQIEQVTAGAIKPSAVLPSLSLGVGLAILFSTLRLLFPFLELWHFLLPGYAIAIGLSYVVPKMFVGMAFDAGGVASGPMTATFILAFIQGAAEAIPQADLLSDGFGMIALVALMPIVTLQVFGLRYKMKS